MVGSEWAYEYGNIDKWSICDVDVQSPTIAAPGSVASHVNVLRERACSTIRYAYAHFNTSTELLAEHNSSCEGMGLRDVITVDISVPEFLSDALRVGLLHAEVPDPTVATVLQFISFVW